MDVLRKPQGSVKKIERGRRWERWTGVAEQTLLKYQKSETAHIAYERTLDYLHLDGIPRCGGYILRAIHTRHAHNFADFVPNNPNLVFEQYVSWPLHRFFLKARSMLRRRIASRGHLLYELRLFNESSLYKLVLDYL